MPKKLPSRTFAERLARDPNHADRSKRLQEMAANMAPLYVDERPQFDPQRWEEIANQMVAARNVADKPPAPDDGQVEKWSEPNGIKEWARQFGVDPKTMRSWLKSGKIKNEQLSPRRYRIATHELPLLPEE